MTAATVNQHLLYLVSIYQVEYFRRCEKITDVFRFMNKEKVFLFLIEEQIYMSVYFSDRGKILVKKKRKERGCLEFWYPTGGLLKKRKRED